MKETRTLTLEAKKEIRLLQLQVKIEYAISDNQFTVAKGIDEKKQIYYFVSANSSGTHGKLDFSQFKKDVPQFVFVLNLVIPPQSEIKLPPNAKSYIIQQSHNLFRVLNKSNYEFLNADNPDLLNKMTAQPAEQLDPAQSQERKFAHCEAILNTCEQQGHWSVSQYPPRPYQLRAMKQHFKTRRENKHSMFGLATGTGKTYMFATIAQMLQEKALIIVPLITLRKQTQEQFAKFAPNLRVHQWDAKMAPDTNRYDVFIITLQSLFLVHKQVDFSAFDEVILDEAHNFLSEDRVLMVKQIANSGAKISAFTATPQLQVRRKLGSDGLNSVYQMLGYHYDGRDSIITPFPIKMSIDAQANAPLVTRIVIPEELDIQDEDSDSSEIELKEHVRHIHNTEKYILMVANVYLNGKDPVSEEFYRGQKAVVFCSGIKHAINIEDTLIAALSALCSHPNTINHLAEDFYHKMERDAFHNTNKKGYIHGTHWEGAHRDRMIAKARRKAERRIAAEVIDPTGVWRRRYVENVAREFAQQGKPLTQHDRDIYYSKFRVVKAVYSNGVEDVENLENKKCQKIIHKFRLGGYLMLTGADKLTEGFDDPEVSLIIFARSTGSERILVQGMGRGERINPNDPSKICTVIHFQVNENAYKYRFAYEVVSTAESINFTYGNIEECRRIKRQNRQDFQPLPIQNLSRYNMIDSPNRLPSFFFEAPKRKQPKQEKVENETKKSTKRGERDATQEQQLQTDGRNSDDLKIQRMNETALYFARGI